MAQIIICCPFTEKITEKDKREICNLLEFKKKIKKVLTSPKGSAIIST